MYIKFRVKKKMLIIGLALILIAAGLTYWRWPSSTNQGYQNIKQIKIEGVVFTVEVADTPEERARGLSGRIGLGEQEGMIFIFPQEGKHSFWMKDTLIPLDIIWLDKNWRVVDYVSWVQPQGTRNLTELPTYQSKTPAWFVLEVPGGTIKRITNFKIGSQAEIGY